MPSSGILRLVALVRTDISDERITSIVRVTIIGEVETMLVATSNRVFLLTVLRLLVIANVVPSSPILVTLMMEVLRSSETSVLQEPHCITSQKTTFFIVTAVET
jgi:hypothetical protein